MIRLKRSVGPPEQLSMLHFDKLESLLSIVFGILVPTWLSPVIHQSYDHSIFGPLSPFLLVGIFALGFVSVSRNVLVSPFWSLLVFLSDLCCFLNL